ncbi:MAG: glycosyltransferase family 2 protein [Chloroflexi bacterium]|nr:glycosyltransferase family 2 protein [Chloroflexota bacterium]
MARSEPLVSVVIPVYNGERFLGEAIESVCWQTYRKFEVIVVDDGSTDGSAAIARAAAGVTCIQQENRGLAGARNTGIRAALGQLVALLDADDIWTPDKLARQVEWMGAAPGFEYTTTLSLEFVEDGSPPPPVFRPEAVGKPSMTQLPSTWVVRREAFQAVGLFDESYRYAEDVEWLFRARRAGISYGIVPEVMVLRRFHGENLSLASEACQRAVFRALRSGIERPGGRAAASD